MNTLILSSCPTVGHAVGNIWSITSREFTHVSVLGEDRCGQDKTSVVIHLKVRRGLNAVIIWKLNYASKSMFLETHGASLFEIGKSEMYRLKEVLHGMDQFLWH